MTYRCLVVGLHRLHFITIALNIRIVVLMLSTLQRVRWA